MVSPIVIGIAALVVALIILFLMSYVKASPDEVILVSGIKKQPKVIKGRAGFRIPFLERADKLSLQLLNIDVKTGNPVPTNDYINVIVDAVVTAKIGDEENLIQVAAQNFLNKKVDDIRAKIVDILEGNMREIVGQMKVEEMVCDRRKFAEMVKTNAEPDLAGMGLDIVSFNVQNFIDDNQVIENLGVDNIVKISKNAAIARAISEKEIAVAQAEAAKEANDAKVASQLQIANVKAKAEKEKSVIAAQAAQEAQQAQIEADTQIALKQNELDVKKAELQKEVDTKQAIADAAKEIQAEEQRKIREIKTADANLARQEKEIELQAKQVEITEKSLEANVKKKADAEKYAAQQRADAKLYETQKASEAELFERQKQAEAQQFEAERQAEAKKALADAIKAQGIAEAEAAKAKGEAEAAAIKAKAEAEAEGLMKKAEAMAAYGDAAKQDMQLQALKVYFEQLPAIAQAIGDGYSNVDKIVMFGDQTSKLSGNIVNNLTQISEGLAESLGIDLKSVLNGALADKINNYKEVED